MTRDIDLIRRLLLIVDAKQGSHGLKADDLEVDDFSLEAITYHLYMMADAGMLVSEPFHSAQHPEHRFDVIVYELSWQGHEYLDLIRDMTLWTEIREKMAQSGTHGFALAIELARKEMLKRLETG